MNGLRMEPAGFFRRVSLAPHQMRDRLTRSEDVIVLCHMGVPRLDPNAWSLTIDGLVDRPVRLTLSDLMAYPKASITSFHQCAGSPLQPREPTRRICNVCWSGARLSDVLIDVGPLPTARYLWSYGADYGEFGGIDHPAYLKDLPLERAHADVLIAYELNGAPLPAEHGFPARLVVPGFYGTNSVKWLTRMTLAENSSDRRLHDALVQRHGVRRRGPRQRIDHTGLGNRAGSRHRVAGAGWAAVGQVPAGNLGMGLGRRRRREGDDQRRRRRALA